MNLPRWLLAFFVLFFYGPFSSLAQQPKAVPDAHALAPATPAKARPVQPEFLAYYASVFAGPVVSVADAAHAGRFVGVSFGGFVAHRTMRAFTFPGFDLELGGIQAVQPGAKSEGLFSVNLQPTWTNKAHTVAPYMTGGYSRLFRSGNAINYGAGLNLIAPSLAAKGYFFRVEARDYYTFTDQRQHLVSLRVAFCFNFPDV